LNNIWIIRSRNPILVHLCAFVGVFIDSGESAAALARMVATHLAKQLVFALVFAEPSMVVAVVLRRCSSRNVTV
jgi:hypothetical protein